MKFSTFRVFATRTLTHATNVKKWCRVPAALSSSFASPCRTSSLSHPSGGQRLPCTVPKAPPGTSANAGQWPLTGNGTQGPRLPRQAMPATPVPALRHLTRARSDPPRERGFGGQSHRSRRRLAMSPQRLRSAVGRPALRGGFGPIPGLCPRNASPSLVATKNVSRHFK